MPYPNEHSCPIRPVGDFKKGSFRRIQRGPKNMGIIVGRLKGKVTTATKSFRYPIKTWTEAQARAHCKKQKGTFEPAVPVKG